ncbi:MAG: hypothetical protein ACOYXR_09215 [Nitrospirota bacterium]
MADLQDALNHQLRIVRDRLHEVETAFDTALSLANQIDDQRIEIADYQANVRRLQAVRAEQ